MLIEWFLLNLICTGLKKKLVIVEQTSANSFKTNLIRNTIQKGQQHVIL